MSQIQAVGGGGSIPGSGAIFTIDSVSPNSSGNFTLESTDGTITFTPITSGLNLSASGAELSLGAFGSTPNADGLTLTGTVLNMQPADGTHGGGVSITTQTFAGAKTFSTPIALNSGGTNANLTASNGGIFYSTASAGAILAGTSTAGQIILSGASTAPTWSTATYPATAGNSGNVLTSDGTNWNSTAPAAGGVTGPVSSTNTGIATWNGTGGTALFSPTGPTITSGGTMQNSAQPAFLGHLTSTQTGVTGSGSGYQVVFDAARFNQGSHYSTSTGAFTCPVTGIYQFNVTVNAQSLTTSNSSYQLFLVRASTDFIWMDSGTWAVGADVTQFTASGSITYSATSGDAMTVIFVVAGNGSANVAVVGNSTGSDTYETSFSGYLVC